MAASPSKAAISARLRRLKATYPGVTFQVIRASNGEVDIMPVSDIRVVDDGGSIVILWGSTPRGTTWLREHLPADGPMLGTGRYAVERRYVADIVQGAKTDGMLFQIY